MEIFNEMIDASGAARVGVEKVFNYFNSLPVSELQKKQEALKLAMLNIGITFNVYSDEGGIERIIPFDLIPRIIQNKEWEVLEKGLIQRIKALNLFLNDIYSDQKILKDKIIPAETLLSSKGYLKQCMGVKPAKGIYTHISGIDLIRDEKGKFTVLEDNLRCPSGVSYMLQNRELSKKGLSNLLSDIPIKPISQYPEKLFESLSYLSDNEKPTIAVLTPGIYNSAYYEHSFLAQQMGVELVDFRDLRVVGDLLKYKTTKGYKTIDVLYRRLDDVFIDPKVFVSDSLIGVPGIFEVYKKGKLALANALGTGVADDKVIYTYIPDVIKYYLSEVPIIPNVETYLCGRDSDFKYVIENLENLVVKEANEAGGYGMLIGPHATKDEIANFKTKISQNPRNYIAQPTISLSTTPCFIEGDIASRHIDLRPYVLYGKEIYVCPGGLTRVALKAGSLVVNSSQGGGSKDTWVFESEKISNISIS
jgi:uncharacterized circularly permuted ATP-grasp superfamily protein